LDLLQVFIQKKINKPCYDTLYSYSFDVLDGTVIVLHIKGPSFQLKDYTVNILEVVSNYMHYGSDSQTFEDHKREHIDDMGNDLIENQLLVDDIKKYILIQNHYTKFQHIDKLKG
jgi:ABC-type transporter lipoprotein component MlaA